ncbi:MAG: hypothetical protein A2X42_00545 [Candidatus Margulisbacteria bacterium GWF2_38_17]|nr:MAG: hypothetical protein A2X42_00545 [Candidatus Margulisbacteria bacterium GWF2_38_17]OGI08391.1 MAG: hypothetical protein A2X41_10795 [Candidatus Margulisbacteria bacterium GWE2_39_32]
MLKSQIAQADLQIKSAASLMYFLTGLSSTAVLKEEGIQPGTLNALSDYKSRIVLRPDVKAAQSRIKSAQIGVEIAAGAQKWPSVDFATNYYLHSPDPKKAADWDAQIMIALPNFIGYTGQSKTGEARSVQRQTELALKRLQRQIAENIDDLYHKLEAENSQIQLLGQALDFSDKNVSAVIQDYNYGLSTNLDVLQGLNALVDSKRALNKMQYAYKTDIAKLAAIVADVPMLGAK